MNVGRFDFYSDVGPFGVVSECLRKRKLMVCLSFQHVVQRLPKAGQALGVCSVRQFLQFVIKGCKGINGYSKIGLILVRFGSLSFQRYICKLDCSWPLQIPWQQVVFLSYFNLILKMPKSYWIILCFQRIKVIHKILLVSQSNQTFIKRLSYIWKEKTVPCSWWDSSSYIINYIIYCWCVFFQW